MVLINICYVSSYCQKLHACLSVFRDVCVVLDHGEYVTIIEKEFLWLRISWRPLVIIDITMNVDI
jgi:hypothetical protein